MTQETLTERLATTLDRPLAADLAAEAVRSVTRPDGLAALIALLDELHEQSGKLGKLAIEMLPDLRRRAGLAEMVSWLDLGVALAGSSGAAAIKYFKESPLVLGLIERTTARQAVLSLSLELAESDPNVALEFLRRAPELLTVLPPEAFASWAEIGVELARWDYVLGIEYMRQCPSLAQVLPVEHIRAWVTFGTKLITQNSLGKTDYVGTLEFFRTSPSILGEMADLSVRTKTIEVGSLIADRDPGVAISFLAASPGLMARLPNEAWRLRVLRYGGLVAERDAGAALAYVGRCPDIVMLLGDGALSEEKFGEWFASGMEILGYSAEGARAYFSLETQKALSSVEQAMSGVPLRHVARQLKLFAEGLCGTEVMIRGIPESTLDESLGHARATVTDAGRTILLPELIRRYATKEENARLYTILTAHEAGHLEFGTYELSLDCLADLVAEVSARYSAAAVNPPSVILTLQHVFELYPHPNLIRDLWAIMEDARVEHRLQSEYPGLKRDLAAAAKEAARTRSLTHGLTVRELVADCLLLLTTQETGTVTIPDAIREITDKAWPLCQTVLSASATAEEAVRLADRLYVLLDEMVGKPNRDGSFNEQAPEGSQDASPKASESMSGEYRPITNWTYRGVMQPDLIGGSGSDADPAVSNDVMESAADAEGGRAGQQGTRSQEDRMGKRMADIFVPGPDYGPDVAEVPSRNDIDGRPQKTHAAELGVLYDEWDGTIRDYRSGWCRVMERNAVEGTEDFVRTVLSEHGAAVRLLRRYFESLRPVGWRRVHGQQDGEEVDLDAAITRFADRVAGAELSDRIYLRREKRDRDVAAAFLVDLSGSTGRQIKDGGRRVIDVEKEGLTLLCEALGALGDQYAVYGYSGRGRCDVEFVTVKGFEEPGGGRVSRRIGSMVPLQQNRDGAAIRHAAAKLRARVAKTKLLILISDGRPLDDGYADEYALEDTKMALTEARLRGIKAFCITVDLEASGYLRRMYGDVRFVIMDRAEVLPERLPRIYQRLTA